MDLKNRRTTSNKRNQTAPIFGRSISEHRVYERATVTLDAGKPRSKMLTFFTKLRRKLSKEKNKVFSCTAPPPPHRDPCNLYSYSQNFDDEESKWAEPEYLSRSFSARFASTSSKMAKKFGS